MTFNLFFSLVESKLAYRQSLLLSASAILTYDKVIVRTATHSTLKMAVNLTQIFNFKVNFHQEFELFSKIKNYANNVGRTKAFSACFDFDVQ